MVSLVPVYTPGDVKLDYLTIRRQGAPFPPVPSHTARTLNELWASDLQGGNKHDVESLEQENDHAFDAMGDKVSMLKKVRSHISLRIAIQYDP